MVSIEKSGDLFRLMYDTKGRFVLHRLDEKSPEAGVKLARVNKDSVTANKVPFIVTHDGRTIRYADPLIKVRAPLPFRPHTRWPGGLSCMQRPGMGLLNRGHVWVG